ncbi:replication initiation protein RepC [Parerythrobacter aurantius]|uniref:replication initiation protein RepC n=1 Tax=Parerythrobacter aurantius TaxID=3127706 RepID=UPI0032569C4E
MSVSLTHGGLPDGVTIYKLSDLITEIAPGTCKEERLSATAVRILQYFIRACRQSDFESGKICGTWEQPQSISASLRISTKVLHNAEAELLEAGFIERTHTPHARRSGKRHNGNIVALAGISLRPLIDGWTKWQARREAIELQASAVFCLKQEVTALNREVRASDNPEALERASEILPRGRVSRINDVEKLEALRNALEALLVLLELPSGATKSSDQTEEIVTPNIPESNSAKNCSGARCGRGDNDRATKVTPALVARIATSDYQSILPQGRPPSWHDLVDASATICRWHGISEATFGQACERLGRERAAVCIVIIDRNARLPGEHRYRARSVRKCLAGLLRNPTGLLPMLRAAQGYPEGILGEGSFTPEPSGQDDHGSFGKLASASLAKLAKGYAT